MDRYRNGVFDRATFQTLQYFEKFSGHSVNLENISHLEFTFDYDYGCLYANEISYLGFDSAGQPYIIVDLNQAKSEKRKEEVSFVVNSYDCQDIRINYNDGKIDDIHITWSDLSGDYSNAGYFHTKVIDGKIFGCYDSEYEPKYFLECAWIYTGLLFIHNDADYITDIILHYRQDKYPVEKRKLIAKKLEQLRDEDYSNWAFEMVKYLNNKKDKFKLDDSYTFKVFEIDEVYDAVIVAPDGKEYDLDFLQQRILPGRITYSSNIEKYKLYFVIIIILLECTLWYKEL